MDFNNYIKYERLIGNSIYLTNHYRERYKERVSKGSGKALDFTKKAYMLGKDIGSIDDKSMKKYLKGKIHDGRTCKIYRGYIVLFWMNKAITVFPLPNTKLINKEYIA